MFEFNQAAILLLVCLLLLLGLWWGDARRKKAQIESLQADCDETDAALKLTVDEAKGQQAALQMVQDQLQQVNIHNATLQERLQQHEKQHLMLEQRLHEREQQLQDLQQALTRDQSAMAALETRLQEERKAAAEKLALLEEAKDKLGNEFKLLANQIFEERGKAFSEQNRHSMDEVLKPVREQLGEFRKRVDEVHLNDARDRASLKEHLAQLERLNRQMSEDALGLTQALKGESKAQGNWGEMILERLLETSGLREGHEFVREQSFTNEEGKRLRPDVVVYMPGDKQVVIDSKVSLTDYERAISASDEAGRSAAVAAHLRSLKQHIQTLAAKRYDHLPNVNSPDYVLMFVPIEGAYLMAIEADQSVFESAFESRVAVVTPSTLYATLKLIEHLWRYERQSENVVKLVDRAGLLHDKMVSFIESFESVGQRLKQAQEAYDMSLGRIKTGPGNVVSQIHTLGKLAGKTKKEIPAHLLQASLTEGEEEL